MLNLRAIESFHFGGRNVTLSGLPTEQRRLAQGAAPRAINPDGDYVTGQMYAQVFRLSAPRARWPVLLWHGGGMTGVNWETTPDGRPGWLTRFLEDGWDVIVSDAVERGRASWSRFPEIYAEPPLFRTKNEAWDMFRIGPVGGYATDPSARRAWDPQLFPFDAFDQFACQWVPRWPDHETITQSAYAELVRRVGKCVVVAHSQGGGFALRAAQIAPERIRAIVAIEPSGAPQAPEPGGPLPPHFVLWGDRVREHRVWGKYRATVDAYCAGLQALGTPVQIVDLPSENIAGNSHFPMMDANSDAIYARVARWLDSITDER